MDVFWAVLLFGTGGIAGGAIGWLIGICMELRAREAPDELLPEWVNKVLEPNRDAMRQYWLEHQHLLLSEFEVEE